MARPSFCRRVESVPQVTLFKPQGIPMRELQYVTLTVDELETLRLADLEGLHHDKAAEKMGISRQTFGRIVASARKKVARTLVEGQALAINGGNYRMEDVRTFQCDACGHVWELSFGTGRPEGCEKCQSTKIHRTESGHGTGK